MLDIGLGLRMSSKELSSHYRTGEPISDELIGQLIRTKHVNTGLFNLRQLFFGIFDMKLHHCQSKELDSLDIFKVWNDLRESHFASSDGSTQKVTRRLDTLLVGMRVDTMVIYTLSICHRYLLYTFQRRSMNVENGIDTEILF